MGEEDVFILSLKKNITTDKLKSQWKVLSSKDLCLIKTLGCTRYSLGSDISKYESYGLRIIWKRSNEQKRKGKENWLASVSFSVWNSKIASSVV